tara:strand:- start:302 stop:991 length:690 start_codon:yes stop_codon:yes gene_type:complete
MVKSIALIPARGGSKRISNKNIKIFCGKPLLYYAIKEALDSNLFDTVAVSTDSEDIASVAREYGAEILYMRSGKLSDDFTPLWEVTLDFLDHIKEEGYDYCCTLFCNPFLRRDSIKESLSKLIESDKDHCFSVRRLDYHPERVFTLTNGVCTMPSPEKFNTRTQDLPVFYEEAAQFRWSKTDFSSPFSYDDNSIAFPIPESLVCDIDTDDDWELAELKFNKLNNTISYD